MSAAAAIAAPTVPPWPMIAIAANCAEPANTMTDMTIAASADSPASCATTPKEIDSRRPATPKGMPARAPRRKPSRAVSVLKTPCGGTERRRSRRPRAPARGRVADHADDREHEAHDRHRAGGTAGHDEPIRALFTVAPGGNSAGTRCQVAHAPNRISGGDRARR